MKENALVHLQMLDALSEVDSLNALLGRIKDAGGDYPRSLQDLVSAGFLKAFPRDPTGIPYEYDLASGKVAIAQGSRLFRHNYQM